ncbi:Transcriptional regulator, tetR family [Frankia canadensis]|uniref:Transcriptional regulator, tetR family n=1 Tax=Frankia canadensis TaxID=1836972 RepID=A0A2I2KQG7_9ACTN|nr:TetR/AcrR family transcriptional regulator [Frankia canadensis]SNQ47899.1 Transcriptional regulator, tetR family [Frankia canadensis]SOU55189.1 Transcriptional regulator, tetR family [Frankia canadensis]
MSSDRRRPRADARRNRERLLTEAEAAFREQGTGTSLEAVARRAGVAIGTLYAHFPSRDALVAAVLRERNGALFEHGEALFAQPEPAPALAAWVAAVVEHAAAYQGLAGMLAAGAGDERSELHASCARMNDIGDRLIGRARAAGALRQDATSADIFALMNAAAWIAEQTSREQADRLVRLTLRGLFRTPKDEADEALRPA